MGSYHLRVLRAHPGVELAAIVDPAPEKRGAAPADVLFFVGLTDAVSAVEAEFACLAAPANRLPELTHEALSAGLAMMVEKPMAIDEEHTDAVVADAEQRGLLLAVGLVERCNPAVMALTLMLEDDTTGSVYQVHNRRLSPHPGGGAPTGVALDLTNHDIDVVRFITDDEIERVYAETLERDGNGREDLVSAALRLTSGGTGILEVNWLTPAKVRQLADMTESGLFVVDYLTEELSYYQIPSSDIEWDTLRMMRSTGEWYMRRYGIARREPLLVQSDRFLGALADDGEPAASGHDGVATLSAARAIRRSGAEHAPIVPSYRGAAWR
jgi:UDP-N-acetylglucosamine 3-dehydrogenase